MKTSRGPRQQRRRSCGCVQNRKGVVVAEDGAGRGCGRRRAHAAVQSAQAPVLAEQRVSSSRARAGCPHKQAAGSAEAEKDPTNAPVEKTTHCATTAFGELNAKSSALKTNVHESG